MRNDENSDEMVSDPWGVALCGGKAMLIVLIVLLVWQPKMARSVSPPYGSPYTALLGLRLRSGLTNQLRPIQHASGMLVCTQACVFEYVARSVQPPSLPTQITCLQHWNRTYARKYSQPSTLQG